MRASVRDLRLLVEILALVVITWLLLGWYFTYPISQVDGTLFLAPYTQSQLAAGVDWTSHLYRIGVVGGSPMHDYAGTLPLVQVCSALGVSTTSTLNIVTIFIQVCFGFFGVKAMLALAKLWHGNEVALSAPERIACGWLTAFVPLLGWRLGYGHESIPEGLLPFVVALALVWAARAEQLSVAALVLGWFAVFNGVSGFGAQLIVYSAVFGAPLAVVVLVDRGLWTRRLLVVAATLVSAVLVALPRISSTFAYASSGDAGRALGDSVAYAFGEAQWSDYLRSLPWTAKFAVGDYRHDVNLPLGPLIALAVVLWPRGVPRRIAWALLGGAALAVLFATNVRPISTLLFAAVTPLESFRMPVRAILPVLVWLPSVALAVAWVARERARLVENDAPRGRMLGWLGIAIGCALIASHGMVPSLVREVIAWPIAIGLAVLLRWRPAVVQRYSLVVLVAPLAALGVLAFDQRVPRHVAHDPIEEGPRQLRTAVLAEAPELAMPLNRIIVIDGPSPYRMAVAFAAGLSSIDGDFNPPRRFIELIGALQGRTIPSSSVVFELGRNPGFPILSRLYNIRYALVFAGGGSTLQPTSDANGPAWLPRELHVATDERAIARGLWAHATALRDHAWVLASDLVPPTACTGRVLGATTDALGQEARIEIETTTTCTLVVSMNYVSSLRAHTNGHELRVHPVDIALTGVTVPPGHSRVVIAPVARNPGWTRIASILGVALLLGALALFRQPRQQ